MKKDRSFWNDKRDTGQIYKITYRLRASCKTNKFEMVNLETG